MQQASSQPELVRAIGRWTLVALVINGIVGSGIFGLPNAVAGLVGAAAPVAYLLAAAGIGVIMACFAEVASQFREAGGPYLYARVAFGRFVGIEMGWLAFLVRLTSAAANANLFVIYFAEFWPAIKQPWPRTVMLTVLIGLLAAINVRGVKSGARVSNFFTVAKLVPLTALVVYGLVALGGRAPVGWTDASGSTWLQAILVLVFAYGGFEAALIPMAEGRNPKRDAPFALFVALGFCTALYVLIHWVVMGALADPTISDRPLAETARVLLGGGGAAFIAFGAMISTYGYLSGQMVSAPRLPYALAEQGDFPAAFARVHQRFRTPHVSILVYTLLVWGLAIYGSFLWNAVLSAVARLFTYAIVCAAVFQLRRTQPAAAEFRLPAGPVFAVLGLAFCVVLVARMGVQELVVIGVTMVLALVNWAWARQREIA